LSKKYGITIIEGAGGIMVPVYKKYLFLDLARDLDLPVIIVSRPCLGTINHTLLTIDALKNKGLDISGVIINYSEKNRKGLSEKTNPEVIEKLGGITVLGSVPYSENADVLQIRNIFIRILEKVFY
jgi:dethiobiotin synthetase